MNTRLFLTRPKWGINALLTLSMVTVIVLLMAVTTFLDIRHQRAIFMEGLQQRGLLLATTLEEVLADSIYFTDIDELNDYAEIIRRQPDVTYIEVFQPDGRYFVKAEEHDWSVGNHQDETGMKAVRNQEITFDLNGDVLEVATPITIGREVIGGAQFGLDATPIQDEIRAIAIQKIWQSLGLILIGVVATHLLARHFTRPISRLVDSTKRIADGKFDLGVESHRRDEIGELTLAFAEMAQSLETRTKELLTTNHQLQLEVSERRQTQERLQRSNEELQEFAIVASHDLQEPLRKIRTYGGRLKTKYTGTLDKEGLAFLERIEVSSERMQTLIAGLYTYLRVTTEAQPFTQVDLSQLAQRVVSDLEVEIEQTHAQINIGELPSIEADSLQMYRLFLNLIRNALIFSQPGEQPIVNITGEIIESIPTVEYCQITVRDNGIGFEEKYLDRIFAIFEQLQSQSPHDGTGLGLAVCRKIVDRHRGSISAKSIPGEGTTFVVTLPVKQHNNKPEISPSAHYTENLRESEKLLDVEVNGFQPEQAIGASGD